MKSKKLTILAAGLSLLTVSNLASAQTAPAKPAPMPEKKAAAAVKAVDKWAFLPKIIATVGNQTITKEQFVKDLEAMFAKSPMPMGTMNQDMLKKIAPGMAKQMVDKLVMIELAAASGIKPSKELVKAEFDKMLKALPQPQIKKFEEDLKKQNMTIESYKEKMANDKMAQEGLAIDKWVQENIMPKVKITEADLKDFYKKNKQQFAQPEMVEASHILIKPENNTPEAKAAAKKKAEGILAEITKSADAFEALAAKESACPSGKSNKGSLGKFGRGQMVKEFEEVAFALEPGKISNVVETKFGYHIIKVKGKEKAKEVPFEQVKAFIEKRLKGQKVQEAMKVVLDKEKAKLKVEINLK